MKFVVTKTVDQLDLQALHRVRERLVSQRTGIINQIRAFLVERGIAVRQGQRFLRVELPRILATPPDVLSPRMVRVIEGLASDWQRASRQNLMVKRARSQRREKRLIDFEGNAIAMSPSGRVDAGTAGLRRTGWGRLIVHAFHDLDDANRLVADRHPETLQLRAGQIGIGTGIIKNKLDPHVADVAFCTHIT